MYLLFVSRCQPVDTCVSIHSGILFVLQTGLIASVIVSTLLPYRTLALLSLDPHPLCQTTELQSVSMATTWR
uniref:Uncharacterized protein n=1 Tax=Arion vulgaris TaxID=1028688 RepID=A0A0B6ZHY8_9EUPU